MARLSTRETSSSAGSRSESVEIRPSSRAVASSSDHGAALNSHAQRIEVRVPPPLAILGEVLPADLHGQAIVPEPVEIDPHLAALEGALRLAIAVGLVQLGLVQRLHLGERRGVRGEGIEQLDLGLQVSAYEALRAVEREVVS